MRIFISYRRADLGGHASAYVGRMDDHLRMHFGSADVFLDIETIPAGVDFDAFISQQVAQADVLLAVIGPDWISELRSRDGQADDFVRLEIQAALNRRKHVIPILIGGASMPAPELLPDSLKRLSRKNAFELDGDRDFRAHMQALIERLESLVIPVSIEQGPYRALRESHNQGNTLKFQIEENGRLLTVDDALDLWEGSEPFRRFQCALLSDCGFPCYVWEMPPVQAGHLERPYEFVLLKTPTRSGTPDTRTYAQYFDMSAGDDGVVAFENLGKDSLLVVPSPPGPDADYSDLAAFFRTAPEHQQQALWRMVGRCARERLDDRPLWISVAGGGIAWLHVRLDPFPKYYRHGPYRAEP
jgi:hypothetical protein